jgi:transcriptional regulator with PAS, ATPase and Fis domain
MRSGRKNNTGDMGDIMGKIVLLVPREEMLQTAHNILQEKPYPVQEMRVVKTENVIVEAQKAVADGATIIIARGLQASMVRHYTSIPVVQIKATAQEMALLVMKARQIVQKEIPSIAVVGFKNMYCDMSFFPELYRVELATYYAKTDEELLQEANKAASDKVDLIIGGDTAVNAAKEHQIPSLFLTTTEDSLRQAFEAAENMDYAMSVEKKNAAQFETILDYSFNGVIHIDSTGQILTVNQAMEQMVDISQEKLVGQQVGRVIPQIGEELLTRVLNDGKENAVILEWNHVSLYTIFAPITYDRHVDGAILTFQRIQKNPEIQRKKHTGGTAVPPLLANFDQISQKSDAMQECIRMAKLYAMSAHPVVLIGEPGTEKRMIAESIHTFGNRSRGPFLDVPCAGLSEEQQNQLIFGEKGAVMQTQGGTLLLQDLENLTEANQYRLYRLIRFHAVSGTDFAKLRRAEVRILATVRKPLGELVASGGLRPELYYMLSGLELLVPPLRERGEDLWHHIETALRKSYQQYGRYHVLTYGAREYLMSCAWRGNLIQVESFCERLVLTAQKRSIDEIAVRKLMEQLYGAVDGGQQTPSADGESGSGEKQYSRKAASLREALEQNGGNRQKAALQLGISTSTLWRQMKKYDIEWK